MADGITSAPSSHIMNGTLPLQNTTIPNGTSIPPPTTTSTSTDTNTAQGLTADEIALYDRQIRLWGAQAQERIRSANILLVSLRALGTEIAKNLTLAGIRSLTIIDDEPVTEEDLGAQYFLREEDVGKARANAAIPRLRDLNPRVTIASGGPLSALLSQDQTFYIPYTCVIASDLPFLTLSTINTAARFASTPFYAAGIHGLYGYIFADLVVHTFVLEREKSNVPTPIGPEMGSLTRSVLSVSERKEGNGRVMEQVQKQEIYCPLILANSSPLPPAILSNRRKMKSIPPLLPCLRALFDFERTYSRLPAPSTSPADIAEFTTLATQHTRSLSLPPESLRSDFLRSFLQNVGAEIVPTAAFVGGRLAEDVINVVGGKEQPIQNFALFDGEGLEGRVVGLWSAPPEVVVAGMVALEGMGTMGAGQSSTLNGMVNGNGNGNGEVGMADGQSVMDGAAGVVTLD